MYPYYEEAKKDKKQSHICYVCNINHLTRDDGRDDGTSSVRIEGKNQIFWLHNACYKSFVQNEPKIG